MKDLIILGASGFGREVAWIVERINKVMPEWNLLGFMDDDESIQGKIINGYKVIGNTLSINMFPEAYYVCAVGASKVREKIINKVKMACPEIKFGTIIDPSVEMSDTVMIGEGTIVCAHTIATVNISIGKHVIINLDCTIGHDAIINDYVTLYPSVNISGRSTVGRCVELGTGMQIIQGKTVGDYSILGAGAVVIRDIYENTTAVGCPAKEVRKGS